MSMTNTKYQRPKQLDTEFVTKIDLNDLQNHLAQVGNPLTVKEVDRLCEKLQCDLEREAENTILRFVGATRLLGK